MKDVEVKSNMMEAKPKAKAAMAKSLEKSFK